MLPNPSRNPHNLLGAVASLAIAALLLLLVHQSAADPVEPPTETDTQTVSCLH